MDGSVDNIFFELGVKGERLSYPTPVGGGP